MKGFAAIHNLVVNFSRIDRNKHCTPFINSLAVNIIKRYLPFHHFKSKFLIKSVHRLFKVNSHAGNIAASLF